MTPAMQELLELSHQYGGDSDYVIAGGGNTSVKEDGCLYVKASGTALASIGEAGFAVLDLAMVRQMSHKNYSADSNQREEQVKNDLLRTAIFPARGLRPSVEATLHALIDYRFVVHTHPWLINGLTCSRGGAAACADMFGDKALFVPCTDPGFTLAKRLASDLDQYQANYGCHPQLILLENHGIFVNADSAADIRAVYQDAMGKVAGQVRALPSLAPLQINASAVAVMPVLRMLCTDATPVVVRARRNALIDQFLAHPDAFAKVAVPFTPDHIVYCGSAYAYVTGGIDPNDPAPVLAKALHAAQQQTGKLPKVVAIAGLGLFAVDETVATADTVLDLFVDMLKIAWCAESFAGVQALAPARIAFILNWEVEQYRKSVAEARRIGAVEGKITIITGGAQGFGAGLAELMYDEGANIVVADLNREQGLAKVQELNQRGGKNLAMFVQVDVGSDASVEAMLDATVQAFGGLDIMISNAGILKAGGLDSLDQASFELMTKVNYTGYFLCAKQAARVLRLQAAHKADYFTDIIQINSKSGLKGSNRNFAYAGGKFGGIGLTQSFALELAPAKIKVNSICPGNFFDGPLWMDPDTGLFVQYLRTGKVPGASSVEDVRHFYEAQVPMQRGCTCEDVVRAVYYIVTQQYETGQAIPVTGGQNMLN